MRIVLVGGGTGGHFYPLIAVAESLNSQAKKPDLYYFGPDEFDEEALKSNQIRFVFCPAGKTRRYKSIANFFDFFVNGFGLIVAFLKLLIIYPDVVFSKGGYTSVPVIVAAKLLFIPIVIHESDAVPGRSNRIGAKVARYIAIAHEEVADFFPKSKTALVGIPIRKVVLARYDAAQAKEALGIVNDKPLIYITGGSTGAERLNNQVVDALPQLLQKYRIYHQVGKDNTAIVEESVKRKVSADLLQNYYLQGYIPGENIGLLFSAADLIISRSGSTTLFEIAIHETPALLVPIPETISHDQRSNAYSYARNGAAVVLEEDNFSDDILVREIDSLLTDSDRYQKMVAATRSMQYPDAAKKLADILLSIGKEHGSY